MKYDLDQLDVSGFESLTVALVEELTVTTLGVPDRTSALEVEGPLLWPTDLGGELWEGPTLLSMSFNNSGSTDRRVAAFTRTVDTVLEEIRARSTSLRRIVLATNTTFQEVPQDELVALRERFDEVAVELDLEWVIWQGSDYERMLDAAPLTRRRYLSSLVRQDIIDRIDKYDIGLTPKLAAAIKRLLVSDLQADQLVKLAQAGDPVRSGLPLDRIGIDLPLVDEKLEAAQYVITVAETPVLRRGSTQPNILLLGGPGQGKSTIAQMIAQCYRIALLKGSSGLGSSAGLLNSIERGLLNAGIRLPRYLRYPIRIDLANYVEAATGPKQISIIKYIADRMEKRSPGAMDVDGVRAWLQAWPWLVILDGLDEVASAAGRDTLMEQLSAFTGEVDVAGADVVMVATTRPQGYSGEFSSTTFRYAHLAPLGQTEAVNYGRKLIMARHPGDEDEQERIINRVEQASRDELTVHLMRSPLQVTIMSSLLEGRERAPQTRYELFDAYYETIYAREIAKSGPLARLLEAYRTDIHVLHNWLGLQLQAKSERADESYASLPKTELRKAALRRLADRGHDRHTALNLAEQISKAVTDRLVLIVSRLVDEVGFEVRSIQEFFAGRALATGRDGEIPKRLAVIVEPVHWRNTWLFAAGKTFLDRDYVQRDLLNLLHEADNYDSVRRVVMPGADLALDLLEDNLAAQSPSLQRALAGHALELLRFPPDQDLGRRAATLLRLAMSDREIKFMLTQAVDEASHAGTCQRKAAEVVLQVWIRTATSLGFEFRPRLRQIQLSISGRSEPDRPDSVALSQLLSSMSARDALESGEHGLIAEIIQHFQEADIASDSEIAMSGGRRDPLISGELLDSCIEKYPVARTLAQAAVALSGSDWVSSSILRNLLRAGLQRRPVADEVLALTQIISPDKEGQGTDGE
jgi:hypothetical protein